MQVNRLSDRGIKTITKPGRHADGGGLYLNVSSPTSKSWLFKWKKDGRAREMGLGSLNAVSLARARTLAADARAMVAAGTDPLDVRRAGTKKSDVITFGMVADDLLEAMGPSWRNQKHADQWRMTLNVYAAPIRALPVADITVDLVLGLLRPIWHTKPETASRLRGRVEKVIAAAKARRLYTGENPARWKDGLDALLPTRTKLSRGHHAAMAFAEVPAFLLRLRAVGGISASALEFTILTAARSGEVLGATWDEIDLTAKIWTVPGTRMKGGREHRVPLPDRAVSILKSMGTIRPGPEGHWPIFPGQRHGLPLSNMSLAMVMRRLGVGDFTPHGFRSSFRDWAGEATTFPREIAEAALAHRVGDETETAYRRGDALERRRPLMISWASFLEGSNDQVQQAGGEP